MTETIEIIIIECLINLLSHKEQILFFVNKCKRVYRFATVIDQLISKLLQSSDECFSYCVFIRRINKNVLCFYFISYCVFIRRMFFGLWQVTELSEIYYRRYLLIIYSDKVP